MVVMGGKGRGKEGGCVREGEMSTDEKGGREVGKIG